jgi:anthranilate synthase/aminodeoxychorismate synthase-like glutamine amidotransferase
MILLIDNYDSFTFNVYQALVSVPGADEVRVVRNDELPVAELLRLEPSAVVLSPGPGTPARAGHCRELLEALPDVVPILGICLGHQVLVEAEGGQIVRDPEPVHGRASLVHHEGAPLLSGLPDPFEAARYHSLRSVSELPATLRRIAWTEDSVVMAVQHVSLPRWGVQFHPESILTPHGNRLFENFLAQVPRAAARS